MTPNAHKSVRSSLCLREVKLLTEPIAHVENEGLFEGYASIFGVPDLGKDIVMSGAFRQSLAVRGVNGIKLLWQHNPAEPIGRWISIVEDARGLRVRGKLNLAVSKARDIHALMIEGAIDGLSIGFRTQKSRPDSRHGYRRLEQIDLWEISIVTFPMLPQARVLNVKRDPPRSGDSAHDLQKPHVHNRLSTLLRSLTSLISPPKNQHNNSQ